MGFSSGWVDTIMSYITFVSYSMILNGKVGERFKPSRGHRYGDPLSPFLLLICSEGLYT